jgi:hypothetical protein
MILLHLYCRFVSLHLRSVNEIMILLPPSVSVMRWLNGTEQKLKRGGAPGPTTGCTAHIVLAPVPVGTYITAILPIVLNVCEIRHLILKEEDGLELRLWCSGETDVSKEHAASNTIFMKAECSLPSSQKPAVTPYPIQNLLLYFFKMY